MTRSVRVRSFGLGAAALLGAALAVLGGCATSPSYMIGDAFSKVQQSVSFDSSLQTRAVRGIKQVRVQRIAVMPLVQPQSEIGSSILEGAAPALTAEIYSRMALMPGWNVVPQDDVDDAMHKLPRATPLNMQQDARQLGPLVRADAVLFGEVSEYRERVGEDYGAASPAAVAFQLYLLDISTGQVLWTGKFAKEQKALSDNVLNLASFVRSGARWVRAQDIASEGVKRAMLDLHSRLNLQYNAPGGLEAPAEPLIDFETNR